MSEFARGDPSEIRTARLLLRRPQWDDLDAIHEILSDPKAMLYWSSLPHETIEQTRAWLAKMIEAPPGESDDYVIEREGRVIGKAGCWRLPEIGFILNPRHWFHGYAREAVGAVIKVLFEHHPIEAITADVDPRNEASLALLKGLGFHETGRAERTFKLGELWCDSVYLAIGRQEARCLGGRQSS